MIDEKFKPEDGLDVAAEPEVDLQDVDGCLPEGDPLASQTGHQPRGDYAHAGICLRTKVRQDVLKYSSSL